jgi:leukotriene-A4 hydrolase
MSGNNLSTIPINSTFSLFRYEMNIPIPSYLLSIVVGNLAIQAVGTRSYVITEPNMLAECVNELSGLETMLNTTENYMQTPYIWGVYKIIILPPSFPLGGMENPLLTFASPTIIVGDKS